jgi:hypothetical protein
VPGIEPISYTLGGAPQAKEDTTMIYRHFRAGLVAVMLVLAGTALAGPVEKARNAVDPDCSVGKAARGAATKAVVGVRGNRCDAGETMRDTLGVDDQDRNKRDDDGLQRKRPSND